MTSKDIIDIGFKEIDDQFSGRRVWVLGEEDTEICGDPCKLPIVYYNIEKQTCKVHTGECSIVQRECRTEGEIRKFIDSINFLFHKSVTMKSENTKTKRLSYSIEKIDDPLSLTNKYIYKFDCHQIIEDIDDISTMSSYTHNEFKEMVIDHLLMEFKHGLNTVVFGDPAGRFYIENFDKSVNVKSKNSIVDILSNAIKSSYNKIKDKLNPLL